MIGRRLVYGAIAAGLALAAGAAHAAEVRVLSGAATQPGLKPVADLYAQRSGHTVTIAYATGPEIQAGISSGALTADVIIAPQAAMTALEGAGKLGGPIAPLGKVGVAVAVREGAKRPDLSTVEAFKAAILGARTVIFSRGTSGTYLEGLMTRLGLAEAIAARTERVANGGAVVDRLRQGQGDEIGLSALTELSLGVGKGVVVVGPLPAEVQTYTTYSAAPSTTGAGKAEVAGLIALMQTPEAKALTTRNGLQ